MLAESRRRFGPRGFPVPLLLGVLPLVSARHAEFLHNEVPGITIPEATRARMRAAGAAGTEAGIDMADALLAAVGGRGVRHVPDAELRPLRAGGGARPPDPRAPPGRGGRRLVRMSRRAAGSSRPAVAPSPWQPWSWPRSGSSPGVGRGGSAVPAAGRGPGGLRHRRGLPAGDGRAGRGDDRRHRAADRRRDRGLHAAGPLLRDDRRGGAQRAGPDGPVGRRPARVRRRPRDPVRPPRGRPLPRPGAAVRRARLRGEVPLQLGAPGGVRERHAAAAQALRPRRRAADGHASRSTRRRRRSTPPSSTSSGS